MRALSVRPGALALIAMLAGCSSAPTTILTLDVAPPGAGAVRADYAGLPVAIPAVHVPASIDRAEFVRQVTAGQLKVDDFARWSAPLGTLARDTLIRDLAARLPDGKVLAPGASGRAGRTVTFDVTILSLDAVTGQARMQAMVRRLPDGVPHQVAMTAPLSDATPVAAANAFSTLIGDLADRITADMPSR